jgi:hypothetical protein
VTVAAKDKGAPVEVEAPAGDAPSIVNDGPVAVGRNAVVGEVAAESVAADPAQHVVAMPSLLADGTPEHPDAVVLVDDDPRGVHFEG